MTGIKDACHRRFSLCEKTSFRGAKSDNRAGRFPRPQNRRGLAPLEFVMCLPVLLFVLALIVDAGSKSCWKLRGVVAARDAAWRSRDLQFLVGRNQVPLPNHIHWPPPATMSAGGAGPNGVLEKTELNHPVVRGPTLGSFRVNGELLDQTLGAWIGRSGRTWRPPLLPKLGAEAMNQRHPLIVGTWQYWEMHLPSTFVRRIPYIYQLPQTDASLKVAYENAVREIQSAPCQPALAVLDRDEEVRAYRGRYHDFHPRVAAFCDADVERVAKRQLKALIRRIQGDVTPKPRRGLPGTMTSFWISMYRVQRDRLLRLIMKIEAGEATGSIPALEAAAAEFQAKIDLLEGYLNQLPE
ncbi:MAG TPA: TadE family protein [Pirellulales bacterium]|nr:TadE family protein [Pirellulales bacterium]